MVQIQLNKSDHTLARNQGYYKVRWLMQHQADSRLCKYKHCRFWPEIHRLDSQQQHKERVWIKSSKTTSFLQRNVGTHVAYKEVLNVDKKLVVGPFDFADITMDKQGESNCIPDTIWTRLHTEGQQCNLDTTILQSTTEGKQNTNTI